MSRRSTLPVLVVTLAAGLAVAAPRDDDKQVVPPTPVVPAKLDLPPKNFTEKLPGDVKFDMVYVPAGEYLMGSPDAEAGRDATEGPQHKVAVRAFWLGKCEVTWDEYYQFWKDEGLYVTDEIPEDLALKLKADAITRPTNTFEDELCNHGRDGHPVIGPSHHAAMMYCHWLRHKTKKGYRLATEAEWEYACRAGQTGPYGFDGGADKLGEQAWFVGNSATDEHCDANSRRGQNKETTTHKVGTKKANKFGLHDMHGNVWEWVLDHYDAKYYAKSPADKLPVNVPTEAKWSHVVRGGSWADKPDRLRSAARRASDKTWMKHDPQFPRSIWWLTRMDVIGFRVALPVEEYPDLVGLKPLVIKKGE